jgi:DNA-binding response OmpR family regulator
MNRILIAEDEPRITAFLEKGLRANGFVTVIAEDGHAASAAARDSDFDLLILDLGLPGLDGQLVLRQMRTRGERMPVIILTARQGLADTVAGLDSGADDYVTKPFHFEELLARVRARLRDPGRVEPVILRAHDVEIDLRSRRVSLAGQAVELSAREFVLLETFLRHPGQLLSREQLLAHAWGYDFDPGSNIVDVYIGHLRKKLGGNVIETVRGMGYRLAG